MDLLLPSFPISSLAAVGTRSSRRKHWGFLRGAAVGKAEGRGTHMLAEVINRSPFVAMRHRDSSQTKGYHEIPQGQLMLVLGCER